MTNSQANKQSLSSKNSLKKTDPEKYARLKAEAQAPYKGLRLFFYLAFGASGFIGAVVFLAQLAAGRNITSALPNFALQIGLVALTIWLFRWENK
ncbi:DUF3493 domain-containing protein [Candidatus Gracilibacteria bacterium]|jgi:Low psii accumulation1 / Rep27|nr:DUF3493 domain-containing protein [Candidatus Gracilibacteria bacterium]NJP21129.1 DUF3493 domain-containing protein [Hydrococcus sp. CRU_1_1]